jgi:superfamily II DNA or RNA helicase
MGTIATLFARLDPDSGVRGRQFELICRWYLTTDPLYRRELERVWLWDEWPGRWGADAGIDLVGKARDGGLWAIQAKAYDPRYRIKKSDVDTFLSESARPEFAFRLLIATTNEIGATARRTLGAQEKPGHLLFLADLERAAVDWPTTPSKLEGKSAKPKHPRPHQRRAIRDVVRGFEDADRGQLIMACGTGKTLTALWIREALAAERTLVLLPSLSLLAQTLREWVANAAHEFAFLPVCSDESVTGVDSPVSKTADLGFPVTTEPDEIASFLRKRGPRVVFSTYQSSPQLAKALVGRVPGFDLAVADEAHRCAGRISGDFATILDNSAIRAKRRLFMTATPRYFTGRVVKEAAELDLEVASMDDGERFGPVLHRLTFGEAIDEDLLSNYQVAVVVVNDATFREYAERGVFVSTDGEKVTDARTLAAQIGLAKAMRRFDLRRIVSFHSRVAWARRFSHTLPEVIAWMPARERPKGGLWSSYVSGEMPSGHRDVLLGRLRDLDDERGLLCNARCLAEGVDVPTLDGVAFIDPRRSEVDVVQAVGRAIRKSPDKKVGTVVLPAFITGGDDAETAIESSAFKHVWEVLKALRAHDEQLAEELDELRREMGYRRTSIGRPGKIQLVLPVGVGIDFSRAFDTRLVEHTTATWEFALGVLTRFVEREGHARPSAKHIEDGFPLGSWVSVQRQFQKAGKLGEDRAARLATLPGWGWNLLAASWEDGFAHLLRYVERTGNSDVPDDYVDGDGFRLGQWTGRRRVDRLHGGLDPERESRLEAVSGWKWHRRDALWDQRFAHLRRFAEREGHARVPQRHIEGGFRLGQWVSNQRAFRRRGYLETDKIERLDAVPGWAWNANDARWEEGFRALQHFVEREGHALVPQARPPKRYVEDGYNLGHWVNQQRASYRRGELSSDRAARLEALPGWVWRSEKGSLDRFVAEMEAFSRREGHGRPPTSYVTNDGFRLGDWLQIARRKHRRGKLDPEIERRLEALPRWSWSPGTDSWEEGLDHLSRYVAAHGHSRVPRSFEEADGYRLGRWVHNNRTKHTSGRLDPERTRLLEDTPGWVWKAR